MNYPRILFVNLNFRDDTSGGITLSKLVDHIPREKLFLLSSNALNTNIDIFNEKKQLGNPPSAKKIRKTKKSLLRRCFVSTIGQKTIFSKLELTVDIKKWLDEIKPDFIYFCPDSLANIEFSVEIAKYCNVKIIIHVMDDKVNVKFPGVLGFLYKTRFRKAFKKIIMRASIRLSISDLMAEEYERRYGEKFVAFHNPVDIEKWIPFQKKDIRKKNDIVIIYSGAVGSSSLPILQFCEAIARLIQRNYEIKFNIYTNYCHKNVRESIKSYSFVQLNDYVSYECLPKSLSRADFLLLPLAFENKMKFIRLSMSTKTSEFMITGVPIFVFAPSNTALSQYAKQGKWGHVIDNNETNYISQKIVELIENIELQKEYSSNAISLAIKNHSIGTIKDKFNELIKANLGTLNDDHKT